MVRVSRRLILWVGGGLAALVLLVVAAVLIAVLVIDPNRYKGQIARVVREQTGRELALAGNLQWSVFPWLRVQAGAGSLSGPPGDPAPLARWETLRIGLELMPLLRERQIIVERVAAAGLQVRLHRAADGRVNWDFAAATRGAPPAAASASTESAGPAAVQIDAVELRRATLVFDDDRAGAHWRVSELDFDARIPAGVSAAMPAVENLKLRARIAGGTLPGAGVPVALELARASYERTSGAFAVPRWSARFGEVELRGALAGTVSEDLQVKGRLEARAPSLRAALQSAGVQAPATRDAGVLGPFELAGDIDWRADTLTVRPVSARLDDTRFSGSLGLVSVARREIVFELAGDRLVIDRYLEPQETQGAPLELPLAQLQALHANGTLALENAEMAGATLRGVRLRVVTGAAPPGVAATR